jgi:transposase-like protein
MKPIKEILDTYVSLYAAAKDLDVHANQLSRWLDCGAKVDSKGNIWIKSSKKTLRVWSDEELKEQGNDKP